MIAENGLFHRNWNRRPAQGESFTNIRSRFLPFIESLIQNESFNGAHILLIGHGGLFKLMLPLILTNIDAPLAAAHGIGHTGCIIAEFQPTGFNCRQWGEIDLAY